MIRKLLGMLILYTSIIILSAEAAEFREITYEDAWKEGQFSGKSLRDVVKLYPTEDYHLDEQQKAKLFSSPSLTNLRELDLKAQEVNDADIKELCSNYAFSRIIRLNLSENESLTSQCLSYISDSLCLGSVRDLPQISARYDRPSSEIRITAKQTGIDSRAIEQYNQEPQNHNFLIRYLHPVTAKPTYKPANGIKWLRIEG